MREVRFGPSRPHRRWRRGGPIILGAWALALGAVGWSLGGSAFVSRILPSADAAGRAADTVGAPIAFGAATTFRPSRPENLDVRMAGMAVAPGGGGYWLAAVDGRVFAFGAAPYKGSAIDGVRHGPVVAIAATSDGKGYWVATGVGQVLAYGDASGHGSSIGHHLAGATVGIAATPDGKGYWLATAGGQVVAFGDAHSYGSALRRPLDAGVVGVASTADGRGYWLVTARGQVLAFGDADNFGSLPASAFVDRIVGLARTADSKGYLLASANGSVFTFGDAHFHGSAGGSSLANPIGAFATVPSGAGYWLLPTKPAAVLPPAGPGFVSGRVTSIGDSVMVDAAPDLEADIPGISVQAAVSRQWDAGVALAEQLKSEGQLGASVVVDLGTNGPVTTAQFQAMMAVLAGASRVVFVTVHLSSSYSWYKSVNSTLDEEVPKYPNARLADFNALADAHPQWFGPDGIHMAIGGVGAQAMANLIAQAVKA